MGLFKSIRSKIKYIENVIDKFKIISGTINGTTKK